MAADPDRELVERCRAEDPDALRELLTRFKDAVYTAIIKVMNDQARAEQLAQEVFVRIHRGLPYFQGEASLATWVERTTSELCPGALIGTPSGGGFGAGAALISPSPQFVVRTLGRIRRVGWRREQLLDIVFNVTIALVGIATVGLIWYFVDASGLAALGNGSIAILGTQLSGVARSVAPSVPGYLAAAALIAAVLLAWWWAER
jgi:sigma-70-like protein